MHVVFSSLQPYIRNVKLDMFNAVMKHTTSNVTATVRYDLIMHYALSFACGI